MTPDKLKINQIFNGTRAFEIPFYQRSYVWGEKQWERFLTDMIAVGTQKHDYFLGAIILKDVPTPLSLGEDRLIVIDGQQRLTTIAIFLKVLYLKTGKNGWFKKKFFLASDDDETEVDEANAPLALLHSKIDRDDFEKVMRMKKYTEKLEGTSSIINAYNYFSENLDPAQLDTDRIKNNVQVIDITIDDNDDEQQIFDTINSLGVDLTTAELLKNHLFSESTYSQYKKLWKPAFEENEECIRFWSSDLLKGRTQKKNIEAFLNAFLQIKVHEPHLKITSEEKLEYAKSNALFASYKSFISKYYVGNEMALVKELVDYAEIFKKNFDPNIKEKTLRAEAGLDRINFLIYATDGTTLMPFIMYVKKNVADEDEVMKIFDFIECYIVRRMICKSSTKNYSDLFSENLINAGVQTFEDLKKYILDKDSTNDLAMPDNQDVLSAFKESEHPNYRGLAIMYMLESKLRNSPKLATSLFKYSTYTLEHLMPQKWVENWPLPKGTDAATRIHKIKTLGNFAIATQSLNSTISNSEWSIKLCGKKGKEGLKEYSKDLLTMDGVLDLSIWDEKAIDTRATWLARRACLVWPSFIEGDVVPDDIIFDDEGEMIVNQETGETTVISRDHTQYSIDGKTFLGKSKFVPYFVKKYIEKHKGLTFAQIKETFPDSLMESGFRFLGLICPVSAYDQWDNKYKEQRYHPDRPDSKLTSADGIEFYVNTQWTLDSVQNIIQLAKNDKWQIMIKL